MKIINKLHAIKNSKQINDTNRSRADKVGENPKSGLKKSNSVAINFSPRKGDRFLPKVDNSKPVSPDGNKHLRSSPDKYDRSSPNKQLHSSPDGHKKQRSYTKDVAAGGKNSKNQSQTLSKFCTNCGVQFHKNSFKFCGDCGALRSTVIN